MQKSNLKLSPHPSSMAKVEEELNQFDGRLSRGEEIALLLKTKVEKLRREGKITATKDEFNVFKSGNAAAHDRTAQALERIEQELLAFARSHDRLEERVDQHEKAFGFMSVS